MQQKKKYRAFQFGFFGNFVISGNLFLSVAAFASFAVNVPASRPLR
jgi:hypothetical protein